MIALLPQTHRHSLGFGVNSVQSIVINNEMQTGGEKDVTITVPQWVCGLLKLSARNGELQNLYLLVFPLAF